MDAGRWSFESIRLFLSGLRTSPFQTLDSGFLSDDGAVSIEVKQSFECQRINNANSEIIGPSPIIQYIGKPA